MTRQVLFLQGGGAGTHDEWDNKLCDSLKGHLGEGYEVRYPRMPEEDNPQYATWGPAIRRELAALDHDAVVVGHSVGAALLLQALGTEPLAAVILVAAPFVGEGGWPGETPARPVGPAAVHIFHGLADETVPPSHAELLARAIPPAQLHLLPGRDHQLNNDLREVAEVVRTLASD